MTRASALFLALFSAAWCHAALAFDSTTQSVRATGIAPQVLAAIKEKSPRPSELTGAFAVYFGDSTTPMLGDYEVVGEVLKFTPRFPFVPGTTHRAFLDPSALAAMVGLPRPAAPVIQRMTFRMEPLERIPTARVKAVYPSGEVVPANLLRIYVVFSHPMSRRGIERHIRLLDENETPVEHPFLDLEEPLWDPEARRLTLIFDPGRIKRGLGLNESLGPPLRPGGRYRLVISAEAKDAEGIPLAQEYSREYRVTAADRTSPDPRQWNIGMPQPGTRDALIVVADKALDQPLFERLLRVEDAGGLPLQGDAVVESGGTRWRFVPAQAWHQGQYVLRVAAELEDLAGNRPTRLFDEPAEASGIRKESRETVVPFQIGK